MDLGLVLVLGIAIFGGLVGASLFKKMHIPEVVGFIVIGLIIGQSGFRIVSGVELESFQPIVSIALGFIGFLVGSELKSDTFKKYGRKFSTILFGEGIISFLFVTASTFLLFFHYLHDVNSALAGAVVLGAIASATDPASTLSVLWEYRTLGVLTTSLIAIVALDDALAMTLYGLGSGAASVLAGSSGSFLPQMGSVVFELLLAVLIGGVAAVVLTSIIKRISDSDRLLAFAVGILLLVVGVAVHSNLDIVLMTMTFGCVLTNYNPRRSDPLVELVRRFSNPVYVLFFVLAGARLSIREMSSSLWLVVLAYIVARTVGKMLGSYIGAKISKSEVVIQKYLGMGLFTQGGVAIGLSIMASHRLSDIPLGNISLGEAVVSVVAATTFIVQLVGPPMVKLAARLAGEEGRDVKPSDVIDSWKVVDAMSSAFKAIKEDTVINMALETVASYDYYYFPVISKSEELIGILSLQNMKRILQDNRSWSWLLVSDVMQPPEDVIDSSASLSDAFHLINKFGIKELIVTETKKGLLTPVGILNLSKAMIKVEAEALDRRNPLIPKPSSKKKFVDGKSSSNSMEMLKISLSDVLVSEVRNIFIRDAITIDVNAPLTELLEGFLKDTRIRYIYVLKDKKLIGAVRLNSVVKYLFPYDAMQDDSSEVFYGNFMQFNVDKIDELMETNIKYVTENNTLSEVARILIEEKVNELPVLDKNHRLIGQINVYEVISKYLSYTGAPEKV